MRGRQRPAAHRLLPSALSRAAPHVSRPGESDNSSHAGENEHRKACATSPRGLVFLHQLLERRRLACSDRLEEAVLEVAKELSYRGSERIGTVTRHAVSRTSYNRQPRPLHFTGGAFSDFLAQHIALRATNKERGHGNLAKHLP